MNDSHTHATLLNEPCHLQGLIANAGRGDQDAATALYIQYGAEVRREIRFHLRNRRLQTVEDSSDLVQSAMKSVLLRLHDTTDISTPRQLVRMLRAVARNKTVSVLRRRTAQKRDERRNVPLESHVDPSACEPTTSELADRREFYERCLRHVPEADRRLLELYSEGWSWVEIGEVLRETANAVRKRFERLAKSLRARFGEEFA